MSEKKKAQIINEFFEDLGLKLDGKIPANHWERNLYGLEPWGKQEIVLHISSPKGERKFNITKG